MALTQAQLTGCTFKDHGYGSFVDIAIDCPGAMGAFGNICQKEKTYKVDNCYKGFWWNEPKCNSGDQEIKSEGCSWILWPRKKKTCKRKRILDYGCGCGKTPQSCNCQCVKNPLSTLTTTEASYPCPRDFPNLELGRHKGDNHGDVCRNKARHTYGVGWACPTTCTLVSKTARPYCVEKGSKQPCRIKGLRVSSSRTGKCFSEGYKGHFLAGCVSGNNCKDYTKKSDAMAACVQAGSKCGGIITGGSGHWEIRAGKKLMLRANGLPTHETSFVKGRCATQENCYIGCFVDDAKRDLDKMIGRGNTVETCRAKCAGYKYFGLQDGDQCFCGKSYNTASQYKRVADSQCQSGHGGPYRNSIYRVNCGGCVEELRKNTDVVSGRFKRVPNVAQPAKTRSDQECAELCRNTKSCEYFVRQPSSGSCWRGMGWDQSVTEEKQNDRNLGHVCPLKDSRRRAEEESEQPSVTAQVMDALQNGSLWLNLEEDSDEEVVEEDNEDEELEMDMDTPLNDGSALPGDAPKPLAETISNLESLEEFCEFAENEGMFQVSCAMINTMLSEYLANGMLDVCEGTDMVIGDMCSQ